MKRVFDVFIGVILAIALFGLGYFARGVIDGAIDETPVEASTTDTTQEKLLTIAGVYECGAEAWNGKQKTLIIFEDGTYQPPSGGTGTWEKQDDKTIQFDTGKVQITGYIADTGIAYANVFFEKK